MLCVYLKGDCVIIGKKGKKTKGKVVPWQEFIATQTPTSVPVRKGSSWADEVESDGNYTSLHDSYFMYAVY